MYPKSQKEILKLVYLNNYEVILSNLDEAISTKIKSNKQI